jgi:hypothetical protein
MAGAPLIRLLLVVEALAFAAAALVHRGAIAGYAHDRAATAETVIAVALAAGVVATWVFPARTMMAALTAQSFALLGTLVGVFVVIIGIGPQTVPDKIYHGVILLVLIGGLVWLVRSGSLVRKGV